MSEAGASLVDLKLQLNIVPKTKVTKLFSHNLQNSGNFPGTNKITAFEIFKDFSLESKIDYQLTKCVISKMFLIKTNDKNLSSFFF